MELRYIAIQPIGDLHQAAEIGELFSKYQHLCFISADIGRDYLMKLEASDFKSKEIFESFAKDFKEIANKYMDYSR